MIEGQLNIYNLLAQAAEDSNNSSNIVELVQAQ